MLSKAYSAGAARALTCLGFVKNAEMESLLPQGSNDLFENAMRHVPPGGGAGPLTPPALSPSAIAPAAAEAGAHAQQTGKGLMGFARRNPLLAGGLALGGAVGLGMGAHGLMTGKSLSPQPNVTYNYTGPANPML